MAGVFNGPVTVRSSRQLKHVESTMFHLMDHRVDIHIIPVDHHCHSDQIYELVRRNECNVRKAIFVSRNMLNEVIILDAVVQSAGYEGFKYTCPGCMLNLRNHA